MKKTAFLLIFFFILLPIAYARIITINNAGDASGRIFKENSEEDWNTKVIKVTPDRRGHIFVDVVLNGDVHALLMVDTGAPGLCLTADIARRLGFDLDNMKNVGTIMFLNGMHKVAYVYLKSVNLGGVEQENIPAAVLLEDDKGVVNTFQDGLLGLSLLSKFNFTLDGNNGELTLKRMQ